MSYINYSNGAQAGFQNALAMGMAMGEEVRKRREEKEYKNALATVFGGGQSQGGIVATPEQEAESARVDARLGTQGRTVDDSRQQAMSVIAQRNPALADRFMQREAEQRQAQQEAGLVQRAMAGDDAALTQLATVNFDKWKTLTTEQKSQAAEESKMYGNAALHVLQLPREQRAQAIMGYANQFGSQEIAQIAELPLDQQEAALRAAVAEAQMTVKMIELDQPDYMPVGQDQDLVNVRDPNAVAQFGVNRGYGGNIPPPPPGFQIDGGPASAPGNFPGGY